MEYLHARQPGKTVNGKLPETSFFCIGHLSYPETVTFYWPYSLEYELMPHSIFTA
jgi:hypothetical protein